jgi:hypothetical protein
MKDTVIIETSKGKEEMSRDTFIRWLCLVEIVEMAEEKGKELKINLDNFDWVKPVDFKKYISERFKTMEVDLEREELNSIGINNIHHTQEYHLQTYQKQTF